MIVKFWEREEVRNTLLATGAKYAHVIGRNDDNPADLWTHIGYGFWIGCWHPNGKDPTPPKSIWGHIVTDQHLPPSVSTPFESNGVKGFNSGVPNIRIIETAIWPDHAAIICKPGQKAMATDVIGWRGRDRTLIGMGMIDFEPVGHEFEFTPCRNEHAELSPEGQEGFAKLESGESGGPSFVSGLQFPYLCGIHRGPGDRKPDGTWIAGVDTWLGHPDVNKWIIGVIGEQDEPELEPQLKPEPRIITVKPGEEIVIKGVEK